VAAEDEAATTMQPPDAAPAPSAPGQLTLVDVRRLWPGVLDRVKKARRYAWILLSQNAHVKDVGDKVITIGLVNAGARDSFTRSGADEILRQALIDELGVDWRVESIIDSAGEAGGTRVVRPVEASPEESSSAAPPEDDATAAAAAPRTAEVEAAKAAVRPTRKKAEGDADDEATDTTHTEVAEDDDVIDDASLSGQELLARELGAQVIEEIEHER
jgi:DNA polymerase-3 subunit gamma/tau